MRRISEGGAAIGGKRIPKHRVQDTIMHYKNEVLSLLSLSQWGPIGSTGKKESNGDIDLAIESSMTLEEIKNILDDAGIRNVLNKGLGEINTEFNQYEGSRETEDTVQVDLMIGKYSWLTFMYMGYGENETKYKPLTRTALVYALLRVIPESVNKDGSVDFYSISPNRGFFLKKGKEAPSGFKSKRVNPINNNSPEELANLVGLSVEELKLPFEKLWAIVSSKFPEDKLIKISNYVKDFLTKQKLPVPTELQSRITEKTSVAHMVHLEDLVYEGNGEKMFAYLHDMFNTLKGHTTSARTTVKIDGSPMIAMANNFPGIEGPFVGMKNTFAKVPQVFQTKDQIDEKYGHIPDLANKLLTALQFADLLRIPDGEIWKGDFLFTKEDIKIQNDAGKEFVTFKPNTIVYAIEKGSELGERVLQSDIGIVFHTIHRGEDIKSSEANVSYDVDISRLSVPDNAFILDANLPSLAGKVFLTEAETKTATDEIARAEELFSILQKEYPEILQPNSVQQGLLNKFENHAVRTSPGEDQFYGDPNIYVDKFVDWFSEKYDKESLTKKSNRGKESTIARKEALITYFQSNPGFFKLISLQQIVVRLKKLFISKLENLSSMVPYEELPDGSIKITNHEGFAVSDVDGNIIKFVDRLVFSRANLLGHGMKEKLELSTKQQALNFINSLALDAVDGKITQKSKSYIDDVPTAGAQVRPEEDMSRKDKAQSVLGKVDPDDVLEVNIPEGDTRPTLILNKDSYVLALEFKDKKGMSKKMTAIETEQMESWWMYFMQAKLSNKPYPTKEETKEGFPKMDDNWYQSFISGSEAIYDYVEGDSEYFFSREDSQIPHSSFPPVHAKVAEFFKKKKSLMTGVGKKTDAWNPSDLYLCHKTYITDFFEDWNALIDNSDATLEDANTILAKALDEKLLIGISLKKLTNPSEPHIYNSKDVSGSKLDCSLKRIKLSTYTLAKSPKVLRAEGVGFDFSVSGKRNMEISGQFRYFGDTAPSKKYCGPLRVELMAKGASAQLGKLPSVILNFYLEDLGLEDIPSPAELKAFSSTFTDEATLNKLNSYAQNIEQVLGDVSNIKVEEVNAYLKALAILRRTEERPTKEFIKAGSIIQGLYFVNMLAEATRQNKISEVLSDMLKRSAKMHDVNAPYVKLT